MIDYQLYTSYKNETFVRKTARFFFNYRLNAVFQNEK